MKSKVVRALAMLAGALFAPSTAHALPTAMGPAIAGVTEAITPSGGSYTYTYTLDNVDTAGIWWWGIYFPSDPLAINESNDRAGWVFNGNDGGAVYGFQLDPGPGGWIWTWDESFDGPVGGYTVVTSPNQVPVGQMNVFSFESSTLFAGPKSFFYDTTRYRDGLYSVEALGETVPIPEPATLLLLGSGLAGLALRRRRSG